MESCTLYLDGSGDPGLSSTSKSVHYTVAGVILTPEQYYQSYEKSLHIIQKYVPQAFHTSSKKHLELHYTDILSGATITRSLKQDERYAMVADVYDLLLEIKPHIMASTVNKIQLRKMYNSPYPPWRITFQSSIGKFRKYCNNTDKFGLVISDLEDDLDLNRIKLLHELRNQGMSKRNFKPITEYHMDKITGLCFSPSYLNVGIQLADFIAGAVWQYRERNNKRDYARIKPLWGEQPDTLFPLQSRWKE